MIHKTIVVAVNPGNSHNLDLSLGISPPSNQSKKNDAARDYSFRYSSSDIPNRIGPMVFLFAYII